MAKARLFIDFWNFQLGVNDKAGKGYRVDWLKLSPCLMQVARSTVSDPTLSFEGTRVYVSYDPRKESDKSLRSWLNNFLDRVPGVNVVSKARKIKHPPQCPTCHVAIDLCPHCKGSMFGSLEKGVDTAIVTDLLGLAWESAWDVAVLVSSDRDFIPAIELLNVKGYRIINAHFPPTGMQLAKTCWASIDLGSILSSISR